MKFSFAVSVIAVTTILSIADPVIGGGIRGTRYLESGDEISANEISVDASSDAESGDKIDLLECRNTRERIETDDLLLNCKQIAKMGKCDNEHPNGPNGEQYLYEICRPACEKCLEGEIEITDSPTESLLDFILTEFPTEEMDATVSSTISPTIAITEPPTPSPSAYPTISPTTASPTLISMNQGGSGGGRGSVTISPTIDPILDPNYGNAFTTVPINDIDGLLEENDSAAPSFSPTMPFTKTPTFSPSAYPTNVPTVDFDAAFIDGLDLDDDLLLGIN